MDWLTMYKHLAKPFAPNQITWKPGKAKDGKTTAMIYADMRVYMDRLDDVCGENWSCTFTTWGERRIICQLTINDITRSAVGEMNDQHIKNNNGGTVAEAQAFKRAASKFGVGRYLYNLPAVWVQCDQKGRPTKTEIEGLNQRYSRWYDAKIKQIESAMYVQMDSPMDMKPTEPPSEETGEPQVEHVDENSDASVMAAETKTSSIVQPNQVVNDHQISEINRLARLVLRTDRFNRLGAIVLVASSNRTSNVVGLSRDEAAYVIKTLRETHQAAIRGQSNNS